MNSRSIMLYTVISGLCFLLSNIVLIAGDHARISLLISITFCYLLVVPIGYVLHSLLSFRQRLSVAAFARYAFAMSLNVPLTFGSVWLWRDMLGLPMLWAAPLATGCTTAINFFMSRWAVAGRRDASTKPWASR